MMENVNDETFVPTDGVQEPATDETVAAETEPAEPATAEQAPEEPAEAQADQPAPEVEEAAPEEPAAEPQPMDLAALEEAVRGLQQRFDEKIAVDEHKNQLFDRLYDELQAYKQDLHSKLVLPFVKSVIELLVDTQKFCETIDKRDPERIKKFVLGLPDDLVTLLENHDVEVYEDTESDLFNPRTQRVLKQVPTDDPALEKHIAQRLRPGFRWKGKTLQPEMVAIYKHA